jgi:thymidylate synthase ThyX
MKKTKKTTVTLLSFTALPVETIYCEWQISRTDGPVPSPQEVRARIDEERRNAGVDGTGREFEQEVRKIFEECVAMRVPISETIDFVFGLDNVSIALREQMVRHRVGHKFGGTLGADMIPNLPDSSWWTQSFRQKDLGKFATDGDYLTPDWLELHGDEPMLGPETKDDLLKLLNACTTQGDIELAARARDLLGRISFAGDGKSVADFYHMQFAWIQAAYRRLVKAGMPLEDARNILPLGTSHRLTWKMNLSSLMHVLGNRSCWIAQLGMWDPVIMGMVKELTEKVDPFFSRLVDPPCIKNDHFAACPFEKENKEYIHGRDPHLPCPLWTNLQPVGAKQAIEEARKGPDGPTWNYYQGTNTVRCLRPLVTSSIAAEEKHMAERTAKYATLWGRDPKTGERMVLR